jgi:MFS family permease
VTPGRDRRLLATAGLLRSTGVGMTGVLLGTYLPRLSLSPAQAGLVVSLGLLGSAVGTLLVGLRADRFGRRRALGVLASLALGGGLVVAWGSDVLVLALGAFVGMVNGMGRDRGAAFALEQAILPSTTTDARRTSAFAWYSASLDVGHLLGALLAALPAVLRDRLGTDPLLSYRVVLAGAAALSLGSIAAYVGLSPDVERGASPLRGRMSPTSRSRVGRFAAISAIDSLGGGFLANALLSYWFLVRFGVDEGVSGPLFSAGRVLNMASYALAVRLAARIGLVRTMVFTHVPANLLLLALPFVGSLPLAIAVFLLREGLVEMDVPTRQSYLASIVTPEERTAATSAVTLARVSAWAVAPSFAGALMEGLALSAPLAVGGATKLVYDGLLYLSFRHLRPPEEGGSRIGSADVDDRKSR